MNMIKRVFALVLVVAMLALCGCSTVILGNGTMDLDPNDVDHIVVVNGLNGKEFSIVDREIIGTIVSHINSFTLENGSEAGNGYHYAVKLLDRLNGGAETHFSVSESTFVSDNTGYSVNTKDFLQYLQTIECDTLTDNELIDSLLEGDTLDQLNIVDDEGKISVDKIISLPKSCPALFELLSRPSAIASVSSYGVDQLGAFLNSSNPELVQKAEEWIEILEKLMPEISEKFKSLLNQ